jgi:hypothetical protein
MAKMAAVVAHRNGSTITFMDDTPAKHYKYINEAKRASRVLQAKHGLGSVRRA